MILWIWYIYNLQASKKGEVWPYWLEAQYLQESITNGLQMNLLGISARYTYIADHWLTTHLVHHKYADTEDENVYSLHGI